MWFKRDNPLDFTADSTFMAIVLLSAYLKVDLLVK